MPRSVRSSRNDSRSSLVIRWGACGLFLALALAFCSASAPALVKFDFEQKYYIHPGRQVWDFCVVRPDSVYHIFYHSIHESTPSAVYADTIWHAKSEDLMHWSDPIPILTSGPGWWDSEAMWAPDVVWDNREHRWTMAYTGVDSLAVQRACLAHSPDLATWSKEITNPVFQPDSTIYYWSPTMMWSPFRDPFLFYKYRMWNMLTTASFRIGTYPGTPLGIIHIAQSPDMVHWTEGGIFWSNNGANPQHVLESPQFHERNGWFHLYFAEYDVYGVSHVSSQVLGTWDMSDRHIIDWGGAPEVNEFDPGIDIFSRIAAYQHNQTGIISYVVRFDTLTYIAGGAIPDVLQPHPLDADWVEHVGISALGNPTFGDNTAERGEDPCGLVGNGWFGSREYYQGPLSGRGSPGTTLGDTATGQLKSYTFRVSGTYLDFLVGGGHYPETCYIALVRAANDSILMSATGHGGETMIGRRWDIRPFQGMEVYIAIVDNEQGNMGHINIDEIREVIDTPASVSPSADVMLSRHGANPNPTNPATVIQFELVRPAQVIVHVHDVRGRIVWQSPEASLPTGPHSVTWQGRDKQDRQVPAGIYLYSIRVNGQVAGSGKIAVVR